MPKPNLKRVSMPKLEPQERAKTFDEVARGYSWEMAKEEASRCIKCPKPGCVKGCPVGIDIPGFVRALAEEKLEEAVRILKDKSNLPGICGRVCPQETQCEVSCALHKLGAPVAIGRLERYLADWEMEHGIKPPPLPRSTGKKVAVIGSGPAGLTAAADLARLGHKVTIFEALHEAGGVLVYGIPEFRLPKAIVKFEVEYVKSLGVDLKLDWVVGKTITVDELFADGFHAMFVGTGAGKPMFLNVPGENLGGIFSANEFLVRINLMKAYLFPDYDTPVTVGKRVVVIGGGNVAMDAARCALRMGAHVTITYRRSRKEMPARLEELENAEEEGIEFRLLTNPVGFVGDSKGMVTGMQCMEMTLGEPDASGRRRPIPKPGSEFTIPVDNVVIALGTIPNPLLPESTPGLETTREGTIKANEENCKTTRDKVWAGGDVVSGAATVISAMGAGKLAAAEINKFLRSK